MLDLWLECPTWLPIPMVLLSQLMNQQLWLPVLTTLLPKELPSTLLLLLVLAQLVPAQLVPAQLVLLPLHQLALQVSPSTVKQTPITPRKVQLVCMAPHEVDR